MTISETDQEINTKTCTVSELKVHSQRNCYALGAEALSRLQTEVSVSVQLETGTNVIQIRAGSFGYQDAGHAGEPVVMLWIYGGKVINQKTGVPVVSTWSTLNGYDDALTLEVLESATLCAFFFDTDLADNSGQVQLSILRI